MSTGKSPFEIVYGIQLRGITELRYLNQDDFKSAGAKDFATKMQKLHDRVRESYRTTTRSTIAELIKRGENFNLKWEMTF
jgi:hypothetical protein